MANLVNEIADNKAGIKYTERRNWDAKHRLMSSTEKAKRLLDYQPRMEFVDGLKKVFGWLKDNHENIERDTDLY